MRVWIVLALGAPLALAGLLAAFLAWGPASALAHLPAFIPRRQLTLAEEGGIALTLKMGPPYDGAEFADASTARTLRVLRDRLVSLGLRDATVRMRGPELIAVDAPGAVDPQSLNKVMTEGARLTFQLVDDVVSPTDSVLPPDDMPATAANANCRSDCRFVLKRKVLLSGDHVAMAGPDFSPEGDAWAVNLRLDEPGAASFARLTAASVNRRLAIVLDGEVITAPVIRAPIEGRNMQITGGFTSESAAQLATLLNDGALPEPLSIASEDAVQPGQSLP